jgi:replicative DNA helicase
MNTDPNTNAEGSRKPNKSAKSIQSNDGMSNFVFGKLQPQALPLEEAVLGAMLLDRDALPMVMDILQADTFYLEAHQHIFRAIIRLFERSNPVDILTVTEELRKNGELDKVGGAYYLVELSNRVASAANIEYHARIIAQKRIQRELIRVSTLTIRDAYDETVDVFNLLDAAEKGLFDITQNNLSRTFASMGDLSSKVLKHLEEMAAKNDGLTGVPSGFTALDKLTSGWQPSDLAIIAARPGMGKTSFVLAVALNAARDFNKGVAIFSLEMANTQLVQRLISLECEIPGSKMRSGKLEDYEWQMLQTTVERLNNVPIFIDDTAGINIFELRAKCRRLKMQHDIQLVIIDYLQLMSGGTENGRNSNREQEIAGISRALKSMAKELNVPVIALSQLSRAVETRGGSKRPQLSDLRESGCLTGDALVLDIISGKRIPIKELAERTTSEQFMVAALDESDMKLRPYAMSKAFYSGKKPVFELQTASGRSIKASANHPFYTIGGWKRLDELRVGEPLGLARVVEVNLAESDIFWDKIKNIAPLGVQDVYDATVPGAHNFLANDFIVHNSIEQDADIVSFIYRPEYYGILEDESGQSLKGVAEIIIAKHRHGALDNVKLKFIDQFAKFANLDDPTFTGVQQAGASGFNPSTVIARPSRMNTDEDVPF